MRRSSIEIPKLRLDALTDGVFAVAMTLLVIDLRLPETFHPADANELLNRLVELGNQMLMYVVSFYVLGLRWVGMVQLAPRGEAVSEAYTKWALIHLLLITFVPFTTMVVARYTSLAPAVWLYAANTILFALVAMRMIALADRESRRPDRLEQNVGLLVLILASLLTVVASFFIPKWALMLYLVNLLDEPLRWLLIKRKARA
jgi:uncharacterized membrane protein